MRTLLFVLALLSTGCNASRFEWDKDPLVQFVIDDHQEHHKRTMSRWEAYKIVLANRTLAPADKVNTLTANQAVETHFKVGEIGDDGKSLGHNQVQHRYHRHVSKRMLQWDITTGTRCAVEHMKWAGWDAQVYNAGYEGNKKGRGKYHLKKVKAAEERLRQWLTGTR